MITLIVARARNGAIGRDGVMPWHLPEDLKFFQRETLGGAVIMGRNTWHSLPVRPLAGRFNIVVSSDPELAEVVVPSITAAIELAHGQGHRRIYGIGGARIYKEMLPLAHRLLISEVDIEIDDADTFFPKVDFTAWDAISVQPLRSDKPACRLHEYLRRT
ncbi:dihydrofolate reductase [Pontibaca salina]|uniref:Dihydrofolate reductase n=1 Tax=Pontibaca salina TaxID=2795731 RepID=A0A934HN74_9RHOB|nr:dihydrofolate reductase [Pontibaca salina]MBI6630061.1 dihydrofolate reductase [Pontibaca salina]